jgi:hypothetical protein
MKQRDKKLASKPRLNMSFSELVQRIIQKDLNGEQEKLDKPKQKKTTPVRPRRRKKSGSAISR